MVDFVGLLKRTIDAQSSPTPALRRRIYDRTRETVEKQMAGRHIDANILALQRRLLEKAIAEVETHYSEAESRGADVFSALRENAGIAAPAAKAEGGGAPRPGAYGFAAEAERLPAGADTPPFAAYGRQAASAAYPAQTAAGAGGNAYFARPPAEAARLREAAYGSGLSQSGAGGGDDAAEIMGFSPRRGESGRGGALFQLEDEEAEERERRFSPYGESGREQRSYEENRGKSPVYSEDAFARRALDEPVAPLPDFDDIREEAYAEAQQSAAPAAAYGETAAQPNGQAERPSERRSGGSPYAPPPYALGGNLYADESAPQRGNAAPLSPYNIEQESAAEDYPALPPQRGFAPQADYRGAAAQNGVSQAEQPEENIRRDYSSLHDFLFGETEQAEAAAARGGAPERGDYPRQNAEPLFDTQDYDAQAPQSRAAPERGEAGFSPLPDFLSEEPPAPKAAAFSPAENTRRAESGSFDAFDFDSAFAEEEEADTRRAERRGSAAEDGALLPESALNAADGFDADVLLPEMQSGKQSAQALNEDNAALADGAGSRIASGIFAQAAMREKRRSGKKRLLTGGAVILALIALLGAIFWFLTDFLHGDKHSLAAQMRENSQTEQTPPETAAVEKTNQRLTDDGSEISAAPPAAEAKPETSAANGAETLPAAPQAEAAAQGEAVFREARTALMSATEAKGAAAWSLLHEKTPEGAEDTVLRGELSVPARDMVVRLTLRPNHDKSIPAVFLAELMFIVPENFEGGAIDKISPLMFKATEQSTGQGLLDSRVYKISDNFFVVTLNTPEAGRNPKLQRNIALMEQLPWLSLNVAYKNGRIGEFTFGKGEAGETLFKQFFEAQSSAAAENSGAPAPQAEAAP